jgi:hypothetical protein
MSITLPEIVVTAPPRAQPSLLSMDESCIKLGRRGSGIG